MTKTYKELIVWQKSYKLSVLIYKITNKFPKEEIYGITSQIRRAAVSLPSNIAEGYCRQRRKEYLQFLQISYGSGAELETQLLIARDLGYFQKDLFFEADELLSEVMKMLNTLIYRVKDSIKSNS